MIWRHSAAAKGERAEFCVQTNSAGCGPTAAGAGGSGSADGTKQTYQRRPSPLDWHRVISPADSSTSRWYANELDARPERS